mmetsp:Transcript_22243/g.65903  ORF Transcript_22243/g.65903 Transcript_22243/m.65903 type:complete len:462 (+) Transcript_22243:552-1937(+)
MTVRREQRTVPVGAELFLGRRAARPPFSVRDRRDLREEVSAVARFVPLRGGLHPLGLHGRHDLEKNLEHLLGEHVIVPLDRRVHEVRRGQFRQSRAVKVSVSAARLATILNAVGRYSRHEGFEGRRGRVDVGDFRLGHFFAAAALDEARLNVLQVTQDPSSRKVEAVAARQQRKQSMLLLTIIQHLHLPLSAVPVEPLLPHGRVSDRYGARLGQFHGRFVHDVRPHLHHGDVRHLLGSVAHRLLLVLAVLVDVRESHGHVPTGYHHVVELGEAVVHVVVPQLRTDVSRGDARERLVIVDGTEGDDEIVHSAMLPVAVDELSDDHGVIGRPSQRPRPEFGRRQRGGMYDPAAPFESALALGEEGGGRLQPSHVRSVTQLGLGVASDDAPIAAQGEPIVLLLVIAKAQQVWDEHNPVKSGGEVVGQSREQSPPVFAPGDIAVASCFFADANLAAELHQADMLS